MFAIDSTPEFRFLYTPDHGPNTQRKFIQARYKEDITETLVIKKKGRYTIKYMDFQNSFIDFNRKSKEYLIYFYRNNNLIRTAKLMNINSPCITMFGNGFDPHLTFFTIINGDKLQVYNMSFELLRSSFENIGILETIYETNAYFLISAMKDTKSILLIDKFKFYEYKHNPFLFPEGEPIDYYSTWLEIEYVNDINVIGFNSYGVATVGKRFVTEIVSYEKFKSLKLNKTNLEDRHFSDQEIFFWNSAYNQLKKFYNKIDFLDLI